MTLYIPRLRRAVSDYFLQPTSRESAQTLHVVEEYLGDPRTVDTVYKYFISQSSREPHSPLVIAKAVSLLRQYLSRYQPSQDTVQSILHFCEFARNAVGPGSADLHQSLRYLQCLVSHIHAKFPNSSYAEESVSARFQRFGLVPSDSGEVSEYSDSHASGILGASLAAGRNSLAASSGAGSSCGSEHATSKRNPTAAGPLSQPEDSYQKAFVSSNGSPLLGADWHIHRPSGSKGGMSDMFAQEMLKFRPPLAWMEGELEASGSLPDEDGWLAATTIQGVSFPEHLWTVAGSQKLQNQVELQRSSSLIGGVPLFQYKHYMEQEALSLNSDETAAVLEAVCGPIAAGTGQDLIWASEERQMWSTAEEPARSIGQVCATLLVKLIMDLYLKAGEKVSYPLVLQMLQHNLEDPDPATRARAFDIIYNLSLHSQMLMEPPSDLEIGEQRWEQDVQEAREKRPPSRSNMSPLPSCTTPMSERSSSSHRLHPLQEEVQHNGRQDKGKNPNRAKTAEASKTGMDWWLQVLLFDLLVIITQMGEESEAVWSSAAGCFVHMTTCGGRTLWDKLTGFPVKVLSRLLRKSAEFGWSDELYAHLLRLPVNLLYLPDSQQAESVKWTISEERFDQFGGMDELLFHFQHARSSEAVASLVRVLIDYAAKQAGCSSDILAPLVSGLLSPGSLEVVLSACRQGHHGMGEIVQAAIHNCLLERNTEQESPRKPTHQRNMYSQSSFFSSDTHSSSGSFVEPEALDSWKAVLCLVDVHLCDWGLDDYGKVSDLVEQTKNSLKRAATGMNGASSEAWGYLRPLLTSDLPGRRRTGLKWLGILLALQADDVAVMEKNGGQSLLPQPPQHPLQPVADINSCKPTDKVLHMLFEWVSRVQAGKRIGYEFTMLIDQLVSHLISAQSAVEGSSAGPMVNGKRGGVSGRGRLLFGTLHVAMEWVKLMPEEERRQPLLSITDHIFETVHAPPQLAPMSGTPSGGQQGYRPFTQSSTSGSGVVPGPGPFLHMDFLVGAGAVYVRLLRIIPMKLLVDLMEALDGFAPAYILSSCALRLGFHGRPGHKNRGRTSHTNVPWSDTVSDMRAALALLLLHRLTIDTKGDEQLKSMTEGLLKDSDVRVRYFASRHLLKQFMQQKPDDCRRALRQFVAQAQQINDERLVDNPYLQVGHILDTCITE
ncbi:hypothetical protein BSKO_01354 [Bryopsis sp. KO-2023]|nr:hypothetical protein BSKO_01354 [Bryopsis sp. KO-2023]